MKKIVATIGPKSETREVLEKILPKIAIARMNMSHGSYEEHQAKIDLVRSVDPTCEILIDLQWPKIRIGKFPNGKVHYKKGERTKMIYDLANIANCDKDHLYVSIPELIADLTVGDELLFNDGYIIANVVEKISPTELVIEMKNAWDLSNNKWVNSSTASLSISPLTEKDLADLEFWVKQNPEYIALSFARSVEDVRMIKKLIADRNSNAKTVIKVERHEAIKDLEAITMEADVIMIARGDLGVECDLTDLPVYQLRMIELCKKHNKPVIWATQVLESMINCPRPTRAEVTDLYTAITAGADYTMLSAESAMGDFVQESIDFMDTMWTKYSK